MADRHLNLFYSYHIEESSLLFEDNLTRAFIQVLRLLSGPVRDRLLRSLFSISKKSAELTAYNYERAETALQEHMDECVSRRCVGKHVITIATRRPDEEPDDGERRHDPEGGSRPDAWIFDGQNSEYCLLLECKRGGYEVNRSQIQRHASRWFGMDAADVQIDLTWYDVLKTVEQEQQYAREAAQHEREYALSGLIGFLDQFGYRLFKGFRFAELQEVPDFRLASTRATPPEHGGMFNFAELKPPLDFSLQTAASSSPTDKNRLFPFEALGAAPAFRLCSRKGDKHGR
jgi:hypothetical protein